MTMTSKPVRNLLLHHHANPRQSTPPTPTDSGSDESHSNEDEPANQAAWGKSKRSYYKVDTHETDEDEDEELDDNERGDPPP